MKAKKESALRELIKELSEEKEELESKVEKLEREIIFLKKMAE